MEQEKRVLIRKQFEISSNKDKKNVILYLLDMGYDNKDLTEILGVNAKKIYNIKRQQLISCLYKCFQDNITICGEDAGLHLLVSFHFDLPITLNLMEYGIAAEFARNYSLSSTSYNNHLIIGFAGLRLQEIETGINQLYLALKPYIQNRT